MQAKDIQAHTWYATKEKYSYPDAVILPGIDRYTLNGRVSFSGGEDNRILFASPDFPLSTGDRWSGVSTGYLAVRLSGDARKTVENWILNDEDQQAAHDIMTEAATLLTKVVEAVKERTKVPFAEIDQAANRERGITVRLITGRELVGDYAEVITRKRDNEDEARQRREAAERATEQRRQVMAAALAKATELGVNTDRYKGGAQDAYSSYAAYTKVEMSVETFQAMVKEIERLRGLVSGVLRADEVGEGGTGASA